VVETTRAHTSSLRIFWTAWIVVVLLLTSSAATVSAAPVAQKQTRSDDTNIVFVTLDELPLGLLLDERGSIDATRFPNFARLASTSTWYPKATTVSPGTHLAVPSILTGIIAENNPYPTVEAHPRSLFTLFARSHEMHVLESFTRLCPTSLCGEGPHPYSEFSEPSRFRESPTRFKLFLSTIRRAKEPGLWFHHTVLPHTPYLWLPDGRPYNIEGLEASSFLVYPPDEGLLQVLVQRFVLQTQYVDRLLGRLLDRLKAQRMLNDTMVVLLADHGAALVAGGRIRRFDTQAGRDGVIPIPLFVKYPAQKRGSVDRREASEIDVLPTIIDALHVATPPGWRFDGRSLLDRSAAPRPTRVLADDAGSELVTVEDFDPTRVAAYLRSFLYANGDPHDPYRIGPNGPLVGQPASVLPRGSEVGTVQAFRWSTYDQFDLADAVPSRFEAKVTGVGVDEWTAIAVNGKIAGLGTVYFDTTNGITRTAGMLDPSFFVGGQNKIEVFVVGAGLTLHPLERLD
jgi:hypothetical protein